MTERKFPNPELEASIAAKTEAAILAIAATGRDPTTLTDEEQDALARSIEFTSEEFEYNGQLEVLRQIRITAGRHAVETLNANKCRIARHDLIPCIQAYFDAVDAGEIEAVAA